MGLNVVESMNIFTSPRLKLERAYSHVQELESLTKPLSKVLYEIQVEREFAFPRPDAIGMSLVYKPTKPVAETLGLIMGDAINNFRAALDHMVSGIVREKNPSANPYFPMSKTRDGLLSNRNLSLLNEVLPGASELLLEQIRPTGSADERFWCFHILDNDSKHNIILPTVSAVNINNINLVAGGITMNNCGVHGDATRPINIFETKGQPITIQHNFNVSVDVRFPVESQFPHYDVLDTLRKIGAIVTETIDAFEELHSSSHT